MPNSGSGDSPPSSFVFRTRQAALEKRLGRALSDEELQELARSLDETFNAVAGRLAPAAVTKPTPPILPAAAVERVGIRATALFRQLETARRTVIDVRDLLPSWLHSFRDPTSLFRRRIWLSLRTAPLRGWHVQQMRRIAIAASTFFSSAPKLNDTASSIKTISRSRPWRMVFP